MLSKSFVFGSLQGIFALLDIPVIDCVFLNCDFSVNISECDHESVEVCDFTPLVD